MYLVFARKYRPQRFEDVVGQEHVARTLRNAVLTGRVAHAYLFCGSRGVGKTTVARILAKALNCKDGPTADPCGECESCRRIATGDDLDVMEIDGASNRGIDEVRELRQNARLVPAHSRFKVYYIDEVHMLSDPAFNALLKTLEEPPPHVKFIFSTTDPQKLPETVKSRCQRFDFRRISDADIIGHLEAVCEKEGLQVEEGTLGVVARAARGSMRDALSTLDQLAAFGERVRVEDALAVLGAVDRRVLARMVDALAREETAQALAAVHETIFGGTDVEDLAEQLSQYLRDLLVASYCGADDPMLAGAAADAETLKRQAALFSPDQLTYMIQLLREAKLRARRDTTGRIALELAVIKMSKLSELASVQEALSDLSNPGSARRAAPGEPAAQAVGPSPVGVLRRMSDKLKKGSPRRAERPERPERPAPPEGVSQEKYRRILASADDPGAAQEALREEPLMRAFIEADKRLGLDPVRLQRQVPQDQAEPDEEEPAEEDDPE